MPLPLLGGVLNALELTTFDAPSTVRTESRYVTCSKPAPSRPEGACRLVKCRGRFVDAVREQRCADEVMRRECGRPDLGGCGRRRRRRLRLSNADDAYLLWFVLFSMCFMSFGEGIAAPAAQNSGSFSTYSAGPSNSPSDLFSPIQISPSVVPHALPPMVPTPPMYPYFPSAPDPVLTGRCPVNISAITDTVEKTAVDCTAPLAPLLGSVICCPQFDSMLRIFQGQYSAATGSLALNKTVAKDCFKDLTSVLISSGANGSIPSLCSIKSSNLTGGSCPIKTLVDFEQTVNTSKLLDACTTVDPLRECCRPVCQPVITEAAVRLASRDSSSLSKNAALESPTEQVIVDDCKGVVFAWLSKQLNFDEANNAFRILFSCKVNKVCPLSFEDMSTVIEACSGSAPKNTSCCSSLNGYILTLQKQMLITNKQALNCATLFGSMLEKKGVVTDLYNLCEIDLKDFSLQGDFSILTDVF